MEKELMGTDLTLSLNAKLQQKKNALRKALKAKGTLKRGSVNSYDNYTYFSESQYKQLFTELLCDHGLELKFTEEEYTAFEGAGKQTQGRMPRLRFSLFDIDTGFGEDTVVTGEGMDKGDKAGYKAYTGALKYYLANTFLVATGDDPEKDSPEMEGSKATAKQVEYLSKIYTGDRLAKLLQINGINRLEDMPLEKASTLIEKIRRGKEQ